jgi:hypothetical protein
MKLEVEASGSTVPSIGRQDCSAYCRGEKRVAVTWTLRTNFGLLAEAGSQEINHQGKMQYVYTRIDTSLVSVSRGCLDTVRDLVLHLRDSIIN